MRATSANFKSALALTELRISLLWKITRVDSTVFAFTDHDQDILYDSVTYLADTGISPSAIQNDHAFSTDNLEIGGIINSPGLTEADFFAGKFDSAKVEIFAIHWNRKKSFKGTGEKHDQTKKTEDHCAFHGNQIGHDCWLSAPMQPYCQRAKDRKNKDPEEQRALMASPDGRHRVKEWKFRVGIIGDVED